jgi:hypothetical protein
LSIQQLVELGQRRFKLRNALVLLWLHCGKLWSSAWASEMGIEAVFDSRSLSFHDVVKSATMGLGVDVVLKVPHRLGVLTVPGMSSSVWAVLRDW